MEEGEMNQVDIYELLKERGPMTVNQIMAVVYPDTPDYQRSDRRSQVYVKLNKMRTRGEVYVCGTTDNLIGPKQDIWRVWE